MDIPTLTKLITLVLAISLAGERLVTLLKTSIPWLAGPTTTTPPANDRSDIPRKVVVMLISIFSCILTAYFVAKGDGNDAAKTSKDLYGLPFQLIGLLASCGSAFWTNILGYLKAVSDIKSEQSAQEKINSANVAAIAESVKMQNRVNLAIQRTRTVKQPLFNQASTLKLARL